jgi:site-specific recombinase
MGIPQQAFTARSEPSPTVPVSSVLVELILSFSRSSDFPSSQSGFIELARWIQSTSSSDGKRLGSLVEYLEGNELVRSRVQSAMARLVRDLNSLELLVQSGIPSDHSLFTEVIQRLVSRFLPGARENSDASRMLVCLSSSQISQRRFANVPPQTFARLLGALFPKNEPDLWQRQRTDLREALRLLATRIAWLGLKPEMRDRGLATGISQSPFYELVACTEELLHPDLAKARAGVPTWQAVAERCRQEMALVHQHMETEGVSVELVFDLRKIDACFARMEAIIATLCAATSEASVKAARHLLELLMASRRGDRSVSVLLRENLDLIARKTVERTGRSGEHYIAHDRSEYWLMWRTAAGGGLLTVFTAAVKMRIMEAQLPPFLEGFASGTNYAVSFVILQVLGLVLATKQPAATAATFAGIVRDNRGVARSMKIADFVSHITSTQLAAAIGNVVAVTVGAVLFERLWDWVFRHSYLPEQSATYVYKTLHPFESHTALYAIITGVILWLAALAGGWCENFATYYRISKAITQHPLASRLNPTWMRRLDASLRRNLGGWATSIVLGYLLGFTPVLGHFFGLPLDVRHVTLSTGTLALAASRFGTESLGRLWLYTAVAGIAVVFVLNLFVSFTIAGMVALRAYDVSLPEQVSILRYLFREGIKSPLKFILPPREPAGVDAKHHGPA